MKQNFFDSNKQNHSAIGYEVNAFQHVAPFIYGKGWFSRGYSNKYALSNMDMSILHCHMIANKARWTKVHRWYRDTHYTVEVYDAIEVNGEFFFHTVYNDIAYTLRDAIHLANIHKSDF